MPTIQEVLIYSLTASKGMMVGFCRDLTPAEYLHRPTPKCNCVAWLLGHLATTDRRVMVNVLGVTDLPPLPDGFEKRFSRDEGCPQAEEFGDVSILLPMFEKTRDQLIERVKAIDVAALEKPLATPHPRFKLAYEAVQFMGLHVAMHAGQISTIRRSLGRPPLV